jgi:hypothetical protein
MNFTLQPTCSCSSVPHFRNGRVVCASCGAMVTARTPFASGDTYSTALGEWPPGCPNRRTARDRIRAVPGHERLGDGKASVWRVGGDAYEAFYARRALPIAVPIPSDEDAIAEAAIAASGMRATR